MVNRVMANISNAAKVLGLVVSLCAGGTALGESPRVCGVAAKRGGLAQYMVPAEPDQDGSRALKVDIDLDGVVDELRWVDPGSGSVVPADNSSFTLTLAANGKRFTLEQQRLAVVKFESRYYVVATRIDSAIGPWQREVLSLTSDGITSVCSFAGKGQPP